MADTNTADPNVNPSQSGGASFSSGSISGQPQPVNGSNTPAPDAAAQVDQNDPVAVAKAAYDKAVADAAAKANGGQPPAQQPQAQQPAPQGEQPKVDTVPSATDGEGIVTYDPTGDAGLDFALSFIGSLGIEGTDPAMVAAANGDFSFIEAKLAAMGEKAKGWEQHIALGKQAYGRQLDAFKAEQGKTLAAVHAVAGGEDQWKALVAWAGTQVSPEEKAALDAMFDAGPVSAAMAARMLMQAHAEAKGTTVKPANPAQSASGLPPAAPTALTQANYAKEVDALYQQIGSRMDTSPEYAAIRAKYFGR